MRNPFRPYPVERGPVKLLLLGDPGTEKTRRALGMPGPRFMVDLEKGADEYGALTQPGDQYLACQSHAALVEALDYLDTVAAKVGTLIIDPITVVWQSLQAGHIEREARRKNIRPEQVLIDQGAWSRLNRVHNDITTRLLNAPYHVVMIARGKELREDDKVVGYGYDGHKSLEFLAKTVVQTRRGGDLVVKDRSGTWTDGHNKRGRLDIRELLANAGTGGAPLESATEAAERDASPDTELVPGKGWTPKQQRAFHAQLAELHAADEPALNYNTELAPWCEREGATDPVRPSGMTERRRAQLLVWLSDRDHRVEVREWAARLPRVEPAEEVA